MKVTTRRKISYVVKSDNLEQAHCLGVNSLAIDTTNCHSSNEQSTHGGTLYSAGRDGIVASWDLHLNLKQSSNEKWVVDNSMKVISDYIYIRDNHLNSSSCCRYRKPLVKPFLKCIQTG